MAENKADKLVVRGSFFDRLRRRRIAIESGKAGDATKEYKRNPKKKDKAPSY